MQKVAVVTDSTANIPEELASGLPIHVVPLQVIWGTDTYRDSVDIHPKEIYTRLEGAKVMPSTSQPSPAVFSDVYRRLIDEGYDILSMHIASTLSGTIDSARQARQNFPGARIEVVDSRTTSMAMGFPVLVAARAAAEGATLYECQKLAERSAQNTGIFFVVKTLEFLRRGGRIGGAAAFLGTALNLKPILELRGGHIEPIDKVRTMSKALDQLLALFAERIGQQHPIFIAGLHTNAPEEAHKILERARQQFTSSDVKEAVISEVSPVIGIHAGPGVVGLAYMVDGFGAASTH